MKKPKPTSISRQKKAVQSPIESEAELREPSFTPENVHEYANETITRPRSDRKCRRSAHLSPTPNDSTSSAHLSPTHEGNNCQQLERTQKILPPRCNGRRVRFMDYEDMKRKTPRRIPVQRYCIDVDGPKTAQSHEDLKRTPKTRDVTLNTPPRLLAQMELV
eukprot:Lankesteria_metandrocarpae@DN5486_c0_g1_i13.p1